MEDRDRRRIVERSEEAANLDLADLSVGQTFSLTHTFDADAVDRFAELCGDFSPLHVDDAYAATTEFGGRVVHGMLLASLFSTLVGMRIPGRRALYLGQELNFRRPVMVGETITATGKVASVSPALGLVQLTTTVLKADGSIAVTGTGKVRVRGNSAQTSAGEVPALTAAPGQKAALVTGASRGLARRSRDGSQKMDTRSASTTDRARRPPARLRRTSCQRRRRDSVVRRRAGRRRRRFDGGVARGPVRPAGPARQQCLASLRAPERASGRAGRMSPRIFEGSVRGPLALSRAAYPHLRASGGAIVNILSQVVEAQPPPQMLDYVVGKFGLLGLTRSLAVEWAADGIRVNGVAPSLLETDMTGHFADRVFKLEASRTPLRRLATVDDVAGAVSYLGGADASFVTGVVLTVAGGRVMK